MQLAAVRFQFPTSLTRSKSTQAEPFLGWVMYPKPMYSIVLPSIKTIVFPVSRTTRGSLSEYTTLILLLYPRTASVISAFSGVDQVLWRNSSAWR
jgi:hypothetical protein